MPSSQHPDSPVFRRLFQPALEALAASEDRYLCAIESPTKTISLLAYSGVLVIRAPGVISSSVTAISAERISPSISFLKRSRANVVLKTLPQSTPASPL